MRNYIDIDIGKSKIAYCYHLDGEVLIEEFENAPDSITKFIEILPAGANCVLEATSVYHLLLDFVLSDAQKTCSILNTSVSSSYAKSLCLCRVYGIINSPQYLPKSENSPS